MATDVTVRSASADDAEAVAALRRTVFPYKVMSAEMLRHAITSGHPGEERLALVAQRNDRVIGWGKAGLNVWTSAPGHSSLAVFVHPDHRGDGIGSALCTRLHQHLRDAGVRLEDLPPRPTPPAGVELRTYDELDPRSVYAAEMLAASDEPGDAPLDSMGYDRNGPMLAVNDWLGYRRVATELGLARDL